MPWIRTFTGKKFDFADVNPDSICLEDIAHGLAFTCRFGGHSNIFYSVADHSVYVANILLEEGHHDIIAKAGLLHDAAEAYIGDFVHPLKAYINYMTKDFLSELEANILDVIYCKYGIPRHFNLDKIEEADKRMCLTEGQQFLGADTSDWEFAGKYTPYDKKLRASSTPFNAMTRFLNTAKNLDIEGG